MNLTSQNFNNIHTTSSGIRLIHQKIDSPVAYCALMMNTGSRDELKNESGAAHLIEHLMFKETGKRKAHHILSRMENVGGELNAYTTKEDTCVHAAFLNVHYARSLELFSDIVFNHRITDKTLQLEKSIVIDELKSSKDSPAEQLFDEFDMLLFPNHPLGRNTLGAVQSVNRLSREDVERFVARNYHPNQMVISSVGNISFQRLISYVEKYFGKIPPKPHVPVTRTTPAAYIPFTKEVGKRNHQSHCIIGTTCDSVDREFRIAITMLANLLGGPGMNTRLNMSLRERHGWVYHVEASYTPYSDVGIFQIYFASDRSKAEKCVLQIEKELELLKKKPLTREQLKKLQLQMTGQLAVASDNNDAIMLSAGKSMLMFDRVDSLHDICADITEVSAERLCEIANEVFCRLSFLTYH
jgi:predicted Zn-dependent peptidase